MVFLIVWIAAIHVVWIDTIGNQFGFHGVASQEWVEYSFCPTIAAVQTVIQKSQYLDKGQDFFGQLIILSEHLQ